MFVGICSYASGQTIQGTIIDEKTGKSIPYANIILEGENNRTIASRDGKFTLKIPSTNNSTQIKVSSLGYEAKIYEVQKVDVGKRHTVKLLPISFRMDTVSIKIGKQKFNKLGYVKAGGRRTGWGDFESSRGRMRGVLIINPEKATKIKSFNFRINDNEWDSVAFRLNFLTVKNHQPDTSILNEDIIIRSSKKEKWVSIDLDKYSLTIERELIVVLEWVDAWGRLGEFSNVLTFSLSKEPGEVYSKEANEEVASFEKADNAPAMFIEVYANGAISPR